MKQQDKQDIKQDAVSCQQVKDFGSGFGFDCSMSGFISIIKPF